MGLGEAASRVGERLLVFFVLVVGGVLLFRMLPRAVSLALSGLASGFGMGPGVSPDAVATNKSFFVVGVVFCVCVV